jgi:eukaryotic-like serine/threonine-protein kinase
MANKEQRLYEFGGYRIDPDHRLLLRGDEPVAVQPKAFDILLVLVENSEKTLSKDELLKAVWPDTFVEESNLAQNIFVLRKALEDGAGKNRYIVTVPGRGYRFAEKVKAILPAEESLVVETQSIQKVTISESSFGLRRIFWWAASLLLIAGGVWGYRSYRSSRQQRAALAAIPKIPARRSVAVLGFRDLTGRPKDAWLSTALAEMLNTELAAGEKLRLVASEDVARTKLDLVLPEAESLSKDTLKKVRQRLGSDVVVVGSYASLGGKSKENLRVDLRVQDAVAGETIAEVAATGNEEDLFDLVSRAGRQLREKLGLEAISMEEAVTVKASLPADPEAARLYANGLSKLRVFDALAARDLLQQAVEIEPKYPLSRAALASAWATLGFEEKAKQEANRAFQLSASLSREDRLAVEGGYRLANHEYAKAIEVYRALFALFPDDLDYGLRLARAQTDGSKAADAIATIGELRKLPNAGPENPRIDLQEAEALIGLGQFQQAREPLRRALEEGRTQGARLLVAKALERECRVDAHVGEIDKAVAACKEARDTYAVTGDRVGEGTALRSWADAIMEKDAPAAASLIQQAIEAFRRVGCESCMAGALNTLGLLYSDQGELPAAEKAFLQGRAIYLRLSDPTDVGVVTSNLANARLMEGDLASASKLYDEALTLSRDAGDFGSADNVLYNQANVQELRGDLSAAKLGFEESLKGFEKNGNSYSAGYAYYSIGQVLLKEADFGGARRALEESRKIRQASGEKTLLAETELLSADLSFEQGISPDIEATIQGTIQQFHEQKELDDEAQAWELLARVLFAKGKIGEALQAAGQAAELSAKSRNLEIRMNNEITAARLQGLTRLSSTTTAEAKRLESIATEALKRGYLEVELEARLAAAEVELKGRPEGAGTISSDGAGKRGASEGLRAARAESGRGSGGVTSS